MGAALLPTVENSPAVFTGQAEGLGGQGASVPMCSGLQSLQQERENFSQGFSGSVRCFF